MSYLGITKIIVGISGISLLVNFMALPAKADSLSEYLRRIEETTLKTVRLELGIIGEFIENRESARRYYSQQAGFPLSQVGQVLKNGDFPVVAYNPGSIEVLTFSFINPATLELVDSSSIASVVYEVNRDPFVPDVWEFIGSSSDSSSKFAINFQTPSLPIDTRGSEVIIRGIPFDSLNNPIEILGVNNENVAVGIAVNLPNVPEPTSTLSLLALGTLGAASTIKRKLKPSKFSEKETTKVS